MDKPLFGASDFDGVDPVCVFDQQAVADRANTKVEPLQAELERLRTELRIQLDVNMLLTKANVANFEVAEQLREELSKWKSWQATEAIAKERDEARAQNARLMVDGNRLIGERNKRISELEEELAALREKAAKYDGLCK